MTHKPPQRPGRLSVPWVTSARGSSDAQVGQAPVRARLVSLLLRPTAPPLALGVVVAAFLIVAETVLVYLLTQVAPGMAFGVVYLIGVLVVSTGWGFGLAAMTSVASALAFDYFHVRSAGSLIPTHAEDWVAIAVFLVVALLANTLAELARSRAAEADQRRREADQRRREADLAAERAHALAELQAALRRVATLVARGVTPGEVYAAVATELARCLGMYYSALWRYEPDGAATLLAARDDDPGLKKMPVGARFSLEGDSVPAMVLRTGRPARLDSYEKAAGSIAARLRDLGLRAAVGAPIVVDGRVWGAAIVGSSRPEPLPPDTEARVVDFTDLVATAIANAQAHAELTASRARIVAAADDARRRLERDLHDGAQQRLVSLGLQLLAVEDSIPSHLPAVKGQVSDIIAGLLAANQELRELSHGLHTTILSRGGLRPAITSLARRSAVPVELDLDVESRLPERVEVTTYYVAAEALTNAAKHAHASTVTLSVAADACGVRLSVQDDGVGGADLGNGSGLSGLKDRVEALGGGMQISSINQRGTTLIAEMPLQ